MSDENQKPFDEYDLKEVVVETIKLPGFVVARSEYFTKTKAPAMTIKYGKVYFNHAAIARWSSIGFIQFLINKGDKKIAIRPCNEDDKDSLQWSRTDKNGRRVVKHIGARFFAAKLYEDFDWRPECTIKLIATLVKAKNEQIYIFDLNATLFSETKVIRDDPSKKPRRITIPYVSRELASDYGEPVEKHDQFLTVIENLPSDYVVLKQAPPKPKKAETEPQAVPEIKNEDEPVTEVENGKSE